MIDFNSIPFSLVPGHRVEFDSSRAAGAVVGMPRRILLIGQRLATGGVVAGLVNRVLSAGQAQVDYGQGSMLHGMASAMLKANPLADVWACALDDNGAGVAATGTLTVTVTTSKSGTIALYVGGRRITVGVAAGAAQNAIATAIAAAITAELDLPVTAVVNGITLNQVDVTARHKGENGNGIDLRHSHNLDERLPEGVSLAVVAMSGGTGNPNVAPALAAVAGETFMHWVMPYTDSANMVLLEADLADRWGPQKMSEGFAWAALGGTHAAGTTWASSRNSEFVRVLGLQKSPTPAWEVAAILAGMVAGESDPARPLQTLPLTGMVAPSATDRYSEAERGLHLADGLGTYTVDAGGICRIERAVTNHTLNTQGLPDASYQDHELMATLAYMRFSWRAWVGGKFPRYKLAANGTTVSPGQAVVTPAILGGEAVAWYAGMIGQGLGQDMQGFKTALVVEIDATDSSRANLLMGPKPVRQFRQSATQIQFS